MSNQEFSFDFNKNDKLVWLAATNPKEFQRLKKFENCEIEVIPVQSICDEIMLKMNEEVNRWASITGDIQRPGRAFWMASQFFIGLVYVHEQQVNFLYDLASRYILPEKFLIENQPHYVEQEEVSRRPAKKSLKRKSANTKARKSLKRTISLDIDSNDEAEDIETANRETEELLRNAIVANNDDISIRESAEEADEEPTDVFEDHFEEVTDACEPLFEDVGTLMQDDLVSFNHEAAADEMGVLTSPLISPRPETPLSVHDMIHDYTVELENIRTVVNEAANEENDKHNVNNSMEMEVLDENIDANISTNSRKRKRKRTQPFKDRNLIINVKQNMKTASTTQRHSNSKDDSVSSATRLKHLSRNIFNIPSRALLSESTLRQFKLAPVSNKLSEQFKRMTLTKTEETNPDMVNEFCLNDAVINHSDTSASPQLNFEASLSDAPIPCLSSELSVEMQLNDRSPVKSFAVPNDPEDMSENFYVQPPDHVDLAYVELSSAIRELLLTNETSYSFVHCDTDSQKLFASRSRQNRLDWGTEGVIKKLMSLWNSGVYPIGMKEIMDSNNHRISAATAFFSIMELNSARIQLIHIEKTPDSNIIFNIIKSQKFIELQNAM